MTRCPNCGSSVRSGAKFCTTCGFRLPSEAVAEPEVPSGRSPFDTTSTSTVSARWPQHVAAAPEASDIVETADQTEADGNLVLSNSDQFAHDTAPAEVDDPSAGAPAPPPDAPPPTGWPAYEAGFGPRSN